MKGFSQIRPINLRDQVAEQIRTAIIEGRLKPNDHIAETTLTQQLGVSRTPVREALILLEREALIVSYPNRGSFVRAFDEQAVDALFSMRTTLENFAAELIVQSLSDDDFTHLRRLIDQQRRHIQQQDYKEVRSTDMAFHQHLINESHHPLLMRSWEEIVAQVAAVLYLRAEATPDYDEYQAVEDHQRILDAYQERDLERIKQENRRINSRVAGECIEAVQKLADQEIRKSRKKVRLHHPVG
jgi:DNA-binding GntR family transcriptional regulator